MKVILLAGGFGSRLSEYTDNTRTTLQQFKKQNLRFLLYTERHFYFNGISVVKFFFQN